MARFRFAMCLNIAAAAAMIASVSDSVAGSFRYAASAMLALTFAHLGTAVRTAGTHLNLMPAAPRSIFDTRRMGLI